MKRLDFGLAIATALFGVAAVVTVFWPNWMEFAMPFAFAISAVAINWARMVRAGSRLRALKSALLLGALVLAVVPAEMVWCSAIRPENCGAEALGTFILFLGLPVLLVIACVAALIDSFTSTAPR